jgi:hypothetical protein
VGLEKDILRNLNKGPRTYEGLKHVFPGANLSQLLIEMEDQHLIRNKEGGWFITELGRRRIARRKQIVYPLLVIPAICFFLLSAQFYQGYTEAQNANAQLLQEKADLEAEVSALDEKRKTADSEYNTKSAELAAEKDFTSQLNDSYEEVKESIDSLQEELNYYECLEHCTPDTFVTVDNPVVKAKVDEITAGLTTLREKQEAVYKFVRDEIEEDEYVFRFGRIDLWEYPEDILERGKGHYEDKYMLLLTMLRIAGTSPEHVKFVAADVDGNDNWIWVEAYDGVSWWVLDPIEGYHFTSTPRDEFYEEHDVKILWWFNDAGFRRG